MIRPGVLVKCMYDRQYYGIVMQYSDLDEEERYDLRQQMHVLEPTFIIKFEENDELDCLPYSKLELVLASEITQLKEEKSFSIYYHMIADKQLIQQNNIYVTRHLPEIAYPCEIGNQLPPEVISATRYHTSENYIQQLFVKQNNNDSAFVKEQIQALSCLQNYKAPVLGRYPAIPNYRNFGFFGNKWVRDYGGVAISPDFNVFINDQVTIEQETVRVERIVKIDSNNKNILIIAGVNPAGVPHVAVSAMVRQTTTRSHDYVTEAPKLYHQLLDPTDLHQLQETEFLYQLDLDNKYGNNFSLLDGLLLERQCKQLFPATLIDVLTCKYQFVQNKIQSIATNESISYAQCKLNPQIYYCYDLQVESNDQILDQKEISDAVSILQQILDSKTDMQEVQFRPHVEKHLLQRNIKCLFCGKKADATSIPLVYGLAQLKRPAFQAVFNPPILCCVHKQCVEHTPEVDMQDFVLKGDQSVLFEVPKVDDDIVKLLIFDRCMRKAQMQQSTVIYDNLREAMKSTRIQLVCKVCGEQGAVIGCFNGKCEFTGHYGCIQQQGMKFNGKEIFCRDHQK